MTWKMKKARSSSMLQKIGVTAGDSKMTDFSTHAVTPKHQESLGESTRVTEVTALFIKEKDNVKGNIQRENTEGVKTATLKSLEFAVTSVTPITDETSSLRGFINDCVKGNCEVDIVSYAIASFSNLAIDEAMNWCANDPRVKERFPRLAKEKQAQVLLYACIGQSLGFK